MWSDGDAVGREGAQGFGVSSCARVLVCCGLTHFVWVYRSNLRWSTPLSLKNSLSSRSGSWWSTKTSESRSSTHSLFDCRPISSSIFTSSTSPNASSSIDLTLMTKTWIVDFLMISSFCDWENADAFFFTILPHCLTLNPIREFWTLMCKSWLSCFIFVR